MTPFDAYQLYLALKLHFKDEDYDYFKYQGKVKANVDSFKARRDRYFFDKIAKLNSPLGFLLSNLIVAPNSYIRDLAYGDEQKAIYDKWRKIRESLTYHFTEQLNKLDDDLKSSLVPFSAQHPEIIRKYLAQEISLETLCIICDITNCLPYWEAQKLNDTMFNEVVFLIKKYLPFIEYDKEKFKQIIRNKTKEA